METIEWIGIAFLLFLVWIGFCLGHVHDSRDFIQNESLEKCAKTNNVYECKWHAVPVNTQQESK